ncbi:hypothetical protein RHWG_00056 [Rhodobacter phage RC1]|uniref:hypothetical protein n=1 Tax=Rhodobacter phage RC1 TaxID=754055 RepID=UPI0002C18BC8|nr:hypothetical protein RHWG_00056 [Rhodobacter phage RC1]AGH58077.1 hypothetical protein RHWG_00056 [Rhodobacter phage RC1]
MGENTIDVANASRKIKDSEIATCAENGVKCSATETLHQNDENIAPEILRRCSESHAPSA